MSRSINSGDFVEPEEVRQKSPETLYCFLDQNRPCTAECVSYIVEALSGGDYINQKWTHCMLLVNVHRSTKIFDKALMLYSNKLADAKRAGNAPYISVDPITGRPL
jgi:hypothetical protein